MDLTRRHKDKGWAIVVALVCMLALVGFWQVVWAQEPPPPGPEIFEGGDAPSSLNHGSWPVTGLTTFNSPMTAYPGDAAGSANFPVVWDSPGVLAPPPPWYGFCHECPSESWLGTPPTCEWDADLMWDQEVFSTNIDPVGMFVAPDTPDMDIVSDDGVQFPTVLPNCGTATVSVQGVNGTQGPLFVNGWADWNRDGDWDDGSQCQCGDDEWMIQDAVVPPGPFAVEIPITPCHPLGVEQTDPLWVRVTLGEMPLGTQDPPYPWIWGGQPLPAAAPLCFAQGETEDYYIEPEEPEPDCEWDKEIYINGEYVGQPDEGPFHVVVSDTITISETMWCNHDHDWDLLEEWDEPPLSLVDYFYDVPPGTEPVSVTTGIGSLEWEGGYTVPVPAYEPVVLTKTLHVDALPMEDAEIEETIWVSTLESELYESFFLYGKAEIGDAPSSWNNFGAPMTAYPGDPPGSANFPVVAFPPAPPSPDGYGICHVGDTYAHLGPPLPSRSSEQEADIGWDEDGPNNIDPLNNIADQDGHDDGVQFPLVMPSCVPVTVTVQGYAPDPDKINAWADWNRDGDWNDGSVCQCGDNEWAIQNFPVSSYFSVSIPIVPCNPVSDSDPFWARFTLGGMFPPTPDPDWEAGGRPASWAIKCLSDGETEDYYVEPPRCEWDKEVYINGEYTGEWDEGPFGVVLSDTITISETLMCNFEYDWELLELWGDIQVLDDPLPVDAQSPLSLVDFEYGVPPGTDVYTDSDGLSYLYWAGGASLRVPPNIPVTLTKTLHVEDVGWMQWEIWEGVGFSPTGIVDPEERSVELVELLEGGDAPSSDNHSGMPPGLPMTAYPPGGPPGVPALYPVVWDSPGMLGPGPFGYGFCHFSGGTSFLGTSPSWEWDADLLPDWDVVTNIDPPTDTPDQDGSDDGVSISPVLPHCGTAMVHVVGQNNSGGPLYINAWFDWMRNGDWADGPACDCGSDEWAIQDYPVEPGPIDEYITITPCHAPGASPTIPLWARVTLSEGPPLQDRVDPEWMWGGQPHPAVVGCFEDGETEDYYIEPEEPLCQWDKEVWIDGEYAGEWDEGPFAVMVSDTVTISDTLNCNFHYDWDLLEDWEAEALSLVDFDYSHGSVLTSTDSLEWFGGYVSGSAVVTLTKTLHVDSAWGGEKVITETLSLSPDGTLPPIDRPIALESYAIYLPIVLKNF